MDWLKKAEELQAQQKALVEGAKAEKRAFSDEEKTNFDTLQSEIEKCFSMHDVEAKLEKTENAINTPVNQPKPEIVVGETRVSKFENFGEQLKAIRDAAVNPGTVDERLQALNAASGANEGNGADGGFAVQSDFAGNMLESAYERSEILGLCDTYDVSNQSNRVEWVDLDEDSIATTVYGGVAAYWAAEAGTVASSKPQFNKKELKLEKLMGIGYTTDEIMQDTVFMGQLYQRAFTDAITREAENAIINGSGVGRPTGILTSAATVEVAKESGQTADTVNWQNIQKMWLRSKPSMRSQYVWIAHPDCETQFENFELPIGTAGIPLSLLPGGVNQDGTSSIKGRPIIYTDQCAALGDAGDIILANLDQYLVIRKGGVQSAESMHVRFLYGENTFRFTFRLNGMPKKDSSLTIKNSSSTRADFIKLAARA